MDSNKVLEEEFEKLKQEIISVYESSGKKVSGNFAEQLEIRNPSENVFELWGVAYLAGRRPGRMPPVENILGWVQARGIQPLQRNMTQTSLAWAIAKKIAREGTNTENHLPIYEQVLTPERIDEIISAVNRFSVAGFVTEIQTTLTKLTQDI